MDSKTQETYVRLLLMDFLDECEDHEDWRETGSGLFRWDKPESEFVDHVKNIAPSTPHDWWVMKHVPGGAEVLPHIHNNWATMVTFLNTHPSALLYQDPGKEEWTRAVPEQGWGVYLVPGTLHKVEANESDYNRYTLILLVRANA